MFALAGLLVSCNDAIDIKQDGEISDVYEVFRNTADVKRGLSGIYTSLPGESEVEFVSVFTDEVSIGGNNGGQGLIGGEYGFFMQPGNDFANSTWTSYYSIVNRVNRLLKVADELVANGSAVASDMNNIKAELHGLRAYANYKLFAYYTPDYTNPSGLSIMKLDYVPDTNDLTTAIGRSTVGVIKNFIVEDVDKALVLRTGSWQGSSYVNDAMLGAIKVKLYSMTGDYSQVLTEGNIIANNANFKLSNSTQFTSIFGTEKQIGDNDPVVEMIFKLKRVVGNSGQIAAAWYSSRVNEDGSYFYEMGRSLYNELDKLDPSKTGSNFTVARNDVRYGQYLDPDSKVATNYASLSQADYVSNDILLIGKFQGTRATGALLQNDVPVFRTADIYLAMAEALASQNQLLGSSNNIDDLIGDLTSVQGILTTIRFNRTKVGETVVVPTITTVQSAWKAILDERRIELAFEGQRYLDMKRIGAKAGSNGFERYSKDCIVNAACNLPVNSFKMTLPIPTTELNSNPIIRGQQNPGY